jgi:hypothetical protein
MSARKTKLPPVVLADPQEIALLRSVRAMSPKARRAFVAALKAMAENRPAPLMRALHLRWLRAIGHPDPEGGADALLRCGIGPAETARVL